MSKKTTFSPDLTHIAHCPFFDVFGVFHIKKMFKEFQEMSVSGMYLFSKKIRDIPTIFGLASGPLPVFKTENFLGPCPFRCGGPTRTLLKPSPPLPVFLGVPFFLGQNFHLVPSAPKEFFIAMMPWWWNGAGVDPPHPAFPCSPEPTAPLSVVAQWEPTSAWGRGGGYQVSSQPALEQAGGGRLPHW